MAGRGAVGARTAIAVVLAVGGILIWQLGFGGSGLPPRNDADAAHADADTALVAAPTGCSAAVMGGLRRVLGHVYSEGLAGDAAATAKHFIVTSAALSRAVERNDPVAARSAAEGVLASGRLTNLRVTRGGRVLANVGPTDAIAPVSGTVPGAAGKPVGSSTMSVWSDARFREQAQAITDGMLAIQAGDHSSGGFLALAPQRLPAQGSITLAGSKYDYTSIPVKVFPSGAQRIYLLLPHARTTHLCAGSSERTLLHTLERVANLIYLEEIGPRAAVQIERVQRDPALLRAVARRDRSAARLAVDHLLNQHVVRLRILVKGHVLVDVGGPHVLGPRYAPLRLGSSTVGSFVLSIQDDLGYLLLANRLAGLRVVMHSGGKVVMNSLGPAPPAAPREGSLRYRGRRYLAFTVHATAFPSGPLRIDVYAPLPYS
jgi:hypothetical protein